MPMVDIENYRTTVIIDQIAAPLAFRKMQFFYTFVIQYRVSIQISLRW